MHSQVVYFSNANNKSSIDDNLNLKYINHIQFFMVITAYENVDQSEQTTIWNLPSYLSSVKLIRKSNDTLKYVNDVSRIHKANHEFSFMKLANSIGNQIELEVHEEDKREYR